MVRSTKKLLLATVVILLVAGVTGYALAQKQVTMVATVGEDSTIVDDSGQSYQVAENEKADELSEQIGKKVEVKGVVEENADGSKMITVESYKVIE
jgi:regulatory protein YycH of two-component signal transduction system YycFG